MGSPAHAGIDPRQRMGIFFPVRFPAHAGIDLDRGLASEGVLRFPRTRGDRPGFLPPWGTTRMVPPHTRG